MEIPHVSLLRQDAARALVRGREPKKVITAYLIITTLAALLITLANYWLSLQMSNSGGLGNLGTRSMLSTIQTILPMVRSVLLMCLELGYLHAMLRVARGQYADHTDLKVGFQRFGPMLRMTLLQTFLYLGVGITTFYLSIQIFTFTPWFDELYTVLMPVMSSTTVLDTTYTLDDATMMQATEAMIPMLILYAVIYSVVVIILSYRFRMANYALLDDPQAGALAAMRSSSKMMRRNTLKLFKLDISFWWYYVLTSLCTILSYGDVILYQAGVILPINEIILSLGFYALYLAAIFAVQYFFRNRMELAYIMAYESICPRPKDNGAVLGNIFDI